MLIQFFCLIKDEGVCNFVTTRAEYLIWAKLLQRSNQVLEFKVLDYGIPMEAKNRMSKWVTTLSCDSE